MNLNFINMLHAMGKVPFKIRKQKLNVGISADVRVEEDDDESFEIADVTIDAMTALFTKWIEVLPDVLDTYPRKVVLSALAKILSFRDKRVHSVGVRGYEHVVKVGGDGPVRPNTRAVARHNQAAAQRGDAKAMVATEETRYSTLPLNSKILSILLRRWKALAKAAAELQSGLLEAFGAGTGRGPFAPAPANGQFTADELRHYIAGEERNDSPPHTATTGPHID
jgi:hypothetical protein